MVKASRQFWYGSRLNRMGGESKHNRGTHTYIHTYNLYNIIKYYNQANPYWWIDDHPPILALQ